MRRLLGLIVLVALMAPAPTVAAEATATPSEDTATLTWEAGPRSDGAEAGRTWITPVSTGWIAVRQPDAGPPLAWRSTDGMTWQATALPDGIGHVDAVIRTSVPEVRRSGNVVVGPGAAIVAGETQDGDRWAFDVWTSRDARDWTLAASPELRAPDALANVPPVRHGFWELEGGGIGALGSYADGEGGDSLYAWVVRPGQRETLHLEIGEVDVVGLDGRLLPAGDSNSIWVVSTDAPAILGQSFGGRLEEVGALPDDLDSAGPIAITRNRDGYVVAGRPLTATTDHLRTWLGTPGREWHVVLDRPGARPESIVADRGTVVLAATDAAGTSILLNSDDFGATWTDAATPWPPGMAVCPGPLAAGSGMLILGAACPPSGAALLYATDLAGQPGDGETSIPTATGALQCDLPRSRTGSGPSAWAGNTGHATPAAAMRSVLREGWVIPRDGYRELARDDGAVLYGFRDRGEVKVAIRVVSVRGSAHDWLPERLASCRLAEFGRGADMGPGVWLWANRQGRTIQERRGAAHCGWQGARFLYWRLPAAPETVRATQLYVRDPEGVFRDQWMAPYLRDTTLPSDARDTGYRRDGAQLWMAADERSVFIRSGGLVQRWPRVSAGIGCA